MKVLQFILIITILNFCYTDIELDECESGFQKALEDKCNSIGSCSFLKETNTCIETHNCQEGNSTVCGALVPKEFHSKVCAKDGSSCVEKVKWCNQYNTIHISENGLTYIEGDTCSDLRTDANGDRCVLDKELKCTMHFNQCSKLKNNDNDKCTNNIPSDYKIKCEWKTSPDTGVESWEDATRYCDDIDLFIQDQDKCPTYPISTSITDYNNKVCIYKNGHCGSEYIYCSDHTVTDESECDNYLPLNTQKNDYDYTIRCTYDSENKCKDAKRKCEDFNKILDSLDSRLDDSLGEDLCSKLEASED